MRYCKTCVLVLLVLTSLSGCYAMNLDARQIGPQVYISPTALVTEEAESVGAFEAETLASWLVWGLVDHRDPELAAVLESAIRDQGGDTAAGVTIISQRTFTDGLLTFITLGFYSRRTVTMTGTVMRAPATSDASGAQEEL